MDNGVASSGSIDIDSEEKLYESRGEGLFLVPGYPSE